MYEEIDLSEVARLSSVTAIFSDNYAPHTPDLQLCHPASSAVDHTQTLAPKPIEITPEAIRLFST